MAGAIRQPIDQARLEKYLSEAVPEIKAPLEIKQVLETPLPEKKGKETKKTH